MGKLRKELLHRKSSGKKKLWSLKQSKTTGKYDFPFSSQEFSQLVKTNILLTGCGGSFLSS
jgi:hypothetical protein